MCISFTYMYCMHILYAYSTSQIKIDVSVFKHGDPKSEKWGNFLNYFLKIIFSLAREDA